MTVQKLASAICKREGKKSQVKIGDMRESLKVLVQLDAEALLAGGETPLKALADASEKIYVKLKAKADKAAAKAAKAAK